MTYEEFPGEKTYVVFHTEGTGEQGGSGIITKELLQSFDTYDEAMTFGILKYPRITGWEWDNFTININTLTKSGKTELDKFHKDCEILKQKIKDNPNRYFTFETLYGTITMEHNEALGGPLPIKTNILWSDKI